MLKVVGKNYVRPGAVTAFAEHPSDSSKMLISYEKGLLIMWDLMKRELAMTFNTEGIMPVTSLALSSVSVHDRLY